MVAIRKDVRDPDAGLRGLPSQVPPVSLELAVIPLRSTAGDSEKLAPRYRDSAGQRSDPANN